MSGECTSDRALLKMAALATGADFGYRDGTIMVRCRRRPGKWEEWNPLKKDGDALRLAADLKINIQYDDLSPSVSACNYSATWINEPIVDDPHAATRRAIVLAAARYIA